MPTGPFKQCGNALKYDNDRLVLRNLNLLQKRRRVEIAKEMLGNVAEDLTFIKCINTSDETWVNEYEK